MARGLQVFFVGECFSDFWRFRRVLGFIGGKTASRFEVVDFGFYASGLLGTRA